MILRKTEEPFQNRVTQGESPLKLPNALFRREHNSLEVHVLEEVVHVFRRRINYVNKLIFP